MKKIRDISDLNEIIKEVPFRRMGGFTAFYRGESSSAYKIRPTLCRFDNDISHLQKVEGLLINDFQNELRNNNLSNLIQKSTMLNKHKFIDDWFNLFQYQHLGLPTRLVDWSASYEDALYFAVDSEQKWDEDGQYWVYLCPQMLFYPDNRKSDYLDNSLKSIKGTLFINHPFQEIIKNKTLAEYRRYNQAGRFSIQSLEESITPFEIQDIKGGEIYRFLVDKDSKEKIFHQLGDRKINYTRIYHEEIPILKEIINYLKKKYELKNYR